MLISFNSTLNAHPQNEKRINAKLIERNSFEDAEMQGFERIFIVILDD